MKTKGNILKDNIIKITDPEYFESLLLGKIRIEKIVSAGHTTPENNWYNQQEDEWVLLLQGEARLLFADNDEILLYAGDYVFIPKHCKHRVSFTSIDPPCLWLAVHGELVASDNKL